MSVAATNTGRSGSSFVSVASHAPPIPRASGTSNATQHADAPIAASTLAVKVCFAFTVDR
jgi:hypothetical protein